MTKYERQYKRKVNLGKALLVLLIYAVIYGQGKMQNEDLLVEAQNKPPEVQVVEKVVYEVPNTPEEYIKWKFGDHADKAFLLLKGDGSPNACAENRTLDPKAVNDNRTWGGKGRDRGIFQISDYYHPSVSDTCAFDFKCNIDYAYRMYINDEHSFRRWTCGRYWGI